MREIIIVKVCDFLTTRENIGHEPLKCLNLILEKIERFSNIDSIKRLVYW